jgi:hypothetical protein
MPTSCSIAMAVQQLNGETGHLNGFAMVCHIAMMARRLFMIMALNNGSAMGRASQPRVEQRRRAGDSDDARSCRANRGLERGGGAGICRN